MIVGIVFFIISALAMLALFTLSIVKSHKLIKNPQEQVDFAPFIKQQLYLGLGFVVSFISMLIWIYPMAQVTPKIYESLQAILGGAIFATCLFSATNLFMVHYYRKNIPEKLDKHFFRIMMLAFTLGAISFFVTTNGYADYWTYPLVNAISLKGFIAPNDIVSGGFNLTITFYALCILGGAILVYIYCNHKMKMEYGDKNIFESTFLVAFPAGIIGGRVGYVIGNYSREFADQPFTKMFAVWEGGLTILGGAIGGIAVGALWFIFMKKKYNIWIAFDLVLPTILIAQAIGRWGNFFNIEVHGTQSPEQYWWWLPRMVFNNAHYSIELGQAEAGMLYVPLFYIEFLVNLFGFFLLAHVFGKRFRKYTELGDIGFGYIIWYGLTRIFMEPLRDKAFNMGSDNKWSWIWAMIYVLVGCAAILANHIIRYYLKKKKNLPLKLNENTYKRGLIMTGIYGVIAIGMMVAGILLMNNNPYTDAIDFSSYNIGLIMLILGISVAMFLAIAIFNVINSKKAIKEKVDEQI